MYGIYANIGGILMGSMLPYIAAPWILWEWIQMANFNIENMIINQWTVGGACLNCQTTFEPTMLLETYKNWSDI